MSGSRSIGDQLGSGVEVGPHRPQTMAAILDEAANVFGKRVAYGTAENHLTYEELRLAARRVAGHLRARAASRVVWIGPNQPMVPALIFGAAWADVTYVPMNHRLPELVITSLVEEVGPAVVATPEWLDQPAPDPGHYVELPTNPAVVVFTSGSSATPKAVILDHAHLLTTPEREVPGGAEPTEAALLVAPPFHVPNIAFLLTSVWAGRRVVPLATFSAEAWLRIVNTEGITHTVVVPTMLSRIVDVMETTAVRVPTLRRLTYGSARMPLPLLERAMRLMPDTNFVNAYGSTESAGAVTILTPDDHRAGLDAVDGKARHRLESVGRPLPGVRIAIVGPDGQELLRGQVGEIWVRGPQVSGRYLHHVPAVDSDGWLRTGDLGSIDADGYLYCAGRGDDLIISGGENISAAEVEDVLRRHPAVSDAAVVGLADAEWGEVVGAAVSTVVGTARIDAETLRTWVRERLGSLKAPKRVLVLDDLPQTATGKVLRREVHRLLCGSTEADYRDGQVRGASRPDSGSQTQRLGLDAQIEASEPVGSAKLRERPIADDAALLE